MNIKPIWVVGHAWTQPGDYSASYYREEDYLKAVDHVNQHTKALVKAGYPKKPHHPELILSVKYVSEGDYELYFNKENELTKGKNEKSITITKKLLTELHNRRIELRRRISRIHR